MADEILPELRRARLTINYNLIGRTDAEIQSQYKQDAAQLSVDEMLYAATLTNNVAEKEDIYKTAAKVYPNDYRAFNNLAGIAINKGDFAAAKNYLAQAEAKKANTPEVNANRAIVALAEGNIAEAENYAARATTAKNYNEILGNINLAKGNYALATKNLAGVNTNSAALAQLLNKDYSAASQTLSSVANPDAMTSYLKAIVAARNGENNATVVANLKDAISKNGAFKAYAAKDLEFAKLFNDAAFQNVVK
ncbi:tetratricopeptide repeat protein [gut metagenome]|uniref:Tetratricopeptide repeat protein n=1 Tax=gut metagenome TaxID=749906 RepID=J9GKE3_9ZZZZ